MIKNKKIFAIILKQLTATPMHTDSHISPQLNGSLCTTKEEGMKNGNELINLSTYQLIHL